jgi:RTX calcium-binding nonapeptide repeat (4 copies)
MRKKRRRSSFKFASVVCACQPLEPRFLLSLHSTVESGQLITGTLTRPNPIDEYPFTASAGAAIEISMGGIDDSIEPAVELQDSSQDTLSLVTATSAGGIALLTYTAVTTGTYYFFADTNNTLGGAYSATVVVLPGPQDAQATLASNQGETGDLVGQIDVYAMPATAGQLILASAGSTQSIDPEIQVVDPAGNLVATGAPSAGDADATISFIAASTGTYDFVILATGGIEGSYLFSAAVLPGPQMASSIDGAGGPIKSGQTASRSLDGQYDAYSIALSAGQSLVTTLGGASATFTPAVDFYDPSGALIGTGQTSDSNSTTTVSTLAATAGTYYLVAESPNGQQGSYSLSLDTGFAPSTIKSVYGVNQVSFNGVAGTGSGQTIAIIDAFNNPDIETDLAAFDSAMNLPAPPSFNVIDENGNPVNPATTSGPPSGDAAAALFEIDLDVEWTHAVAPDASILLIEAASSTNTDLNKAVTTATEQAGVSVVSMSFTTNVAPSESLFTTPSGHTPITFVASSGDAGEAVNYPAGVPNVLAVGGTSLVVGTSDSYGSETLWANADGSSGFGVSSSAQPAYQAAIDPAAGRVFPDVAFVGDPETGVLVYEQADESNGDPWTEGAGTSLGAPAWAGLIAIADQGRIAAGLPTLNGGNDVLPRLYALPAGDFHKVGSGVFNTGTGLGSPVANLLIPALITNAPVLVGPGAAAAPGAPDSESSITFFWNSVTGASSYSLFITTSPFGSGDIVYQNTSLTGTQFTLPAGTLSAGGTYSWYMTSTISGVTSSASPPLYFSIPFAITSGSALSITGTEGNDTVALTTDNGILTVDDNGSDQTFTLSAIQSISVGALAGNDSVSIGAGIMDVTIAGGAGNDTLIGGGGADLLMGGKGADYLAGGKGPDTLQGGKGNDTLAGDKGADSLIGGLGHNEFLGGLGNDIVVANNGESDTIFGGGGNDTASVDPGGIDLIPNNDITRIIVG